MVLRTKVRKGIFKSLRRDVSSLFFYLRRVNCSKATLKSDFSVSVETRTFFFLGTLVSNYTDAAGGAGRVTATTHVPAGPWLDIRCTPFVAGLQCCCSTENCFAQFLFLTHCAASAAQCPGKVAKGDL